MNCRKLALNAWPDAKFAHESGDGPFAFVSLCRPGLPISIRLLDTEKEALRFKRRMDRVCNGKHAIYRIRRSRKPELLTERDYPALFQKLPIRKAIGRSGKPAAGRGSSVEKIAPFLDLNNLKPFVDNDLTSSTSPV